VSIVICKWSEDVGCNGLGKWIEQEEKRMLLDGGFDVMLMLLTEREREREED